MRRRKNRSGSLAGCLTEGKTDWNREIVLIKKIQKRRYYKQQLKTKSHGKFTLHHRSNPGYCLGNWIYWLQCRRNNTRTACNSSNSSNIQINTGKKGFVEKLSFLKIIMRKEFMDYSEKASILSIIGFVIKMWAFCPHFFSYLLGFLTVNILSVRSWETLSFQYLSQLFWQGAY